MIIAWWLILTTVSGVTTAGFASRDFCEAARHALPPDVRDRAVCVSTGAVEMQGVGR